ncbi:uncharacterized protein LOC123539246, partial [Mercenaria mercenaria]|uniref:uncharacterized protein LOC123539246 n=1 Tax=Mercenaria mercenaria TaxID=6596 RepID=UPI00234EF14B
IVGDHVYGSSRRRIQATKKMNCQASIRMKMVVRFPEYKIDGHASQWKKRIVSDKLREEFSASTQQDFQVYLKIQDNHEGHMVGEFSGYGLTLHTEVRQKIQSLVDDGVTNVGEIGRHLERETDAPVTNRRFRPTSRDIRSHVTHALKRKCFSDDDQKNLIAMVNQWKLDKPEDSIFFRPAGQDKDTDVNTSLLFIHQTEFQRCLLRRYGQQMVVIDSTYKSTKYDVPLFIICVDTNVGYYPVCFFLLSRETIEGISEALNVMKRWNEDWEPISFMCDFDKAEVSALENCFEGIEVYICNFHREQSWQRWLTRGENGAGSHKESILKLLRSIAHARTEEECLHQIQMLKSSELYEENMGFRKWIDKQWLMEKKRWVYCFRKDTVNIKVGTTNGVESLNKKLKFSYLKNFNSGSTLSSLAKVMVEKCLPDSQNLYTRNNIVCLSTFKKYSEDVPEFLVNRPKKFVMHCLKRMTPELDINADNITPLDSGYEVRSPSGQNYHVILSEEIPSCTCPDWEMFHWPCKHMLAIFKNIEDIDWNTLSVQYRSLPWFNVDDSVVGTESTKQSSPVVCLNAKCVEMVDNLETSDEDCLRKEKYRCLSILKTIQTSIYCVEDLHTLQDVGKLLSQADEMLAQHIPKISGLPLRTSVNKKRKRRRLTKQTGGPQKRAKKSKASKEVDDRSVIPEGITLEASADLDCTVACSEDESFQSDKVLLHELKKLLAEPVDDLPVVQIGPHTITKRSLHYIQSLMPDDVIDATLSVFVKMSSRNVLHIDLIVATAIFQGQRSVHNYLVQENLNQYEFCIAAVKVGGYHWVLIVSFLFLISSLTSHFLTSNDLKLNFLINKLLSLVQLHHKIIRPATKTIVYINPMGELESTKQTILQNWYEFMQGRVERGIENSEVSGWTVTSVPHSKQRDTDSCGVFVIKFLRALTSAI